MTYFEKSGGIFLVDDPTIGVKFQLWPESVEDQKSVNWASLDVIGRGEPIPIYRGSSYQTLRFELGFVASIDQADNGKVEDVDRKINFLKSLAYPKFVSKGVTTTPPLVWVIFGESIMSRCVLQGIRVIKEGPWNLATVKNNSGLVSERIINPIELLDPDELVDPYVDHPLMARAELEFMVIQVSPLMSDQVRALGDRSNGSDKVNYIKRNKLRFVDQG